MTTKTEIEITAAVFKCQTDEEIFYQRLSAVNGIQKIVTHHSKLLVSVSNSQKRQAIADICAICAIWHASVNTPLIK